MDYILIKNVIIIIFVCFFLPSDHYMSTNQ